MEGRGGRGRRWEGKEGRKGKDGGIGEGERGRREGEGGKEILPIHNELQNWNRQNFEGKTMNWVLNKKYANQLIS